VGGTNSISKVYLPRLVIPIARVLLGGVDLVIALAVLLGPAAYFGIVPTRAVVSLAPCFQPGDIYIVDLGRTVDMAACLFAVLGYMTTNDDGLAALGTACRHLNHTDFSTLTSGLVRGAGSTDAATLTQSIAKGRVRASLPLPIDTYKVNSDPIKWLERYNQRPDYFRYQNWELVRHRHG